MGGKASITTATKTNGDPLVCPLCGSHAIECDMWYENRRKFYSIGCYDCWFSVESQGFASAVKLFDIPRVMCKVCERQITKKSAKKVGNNKGYVCKECVLDIAKTILE